MSLENNFEKKYKSTTPFSDRPFFYFPLFFGDSNLVSPDYHHTINIKFFFYY
jgi:hypothetical protein